jgi:hypothetical protein
LPDLTHGPILDDLEAGRLPARMETVMATSWKKGRGKLGFLQPLLGRWITETDTPMGPVRCSRVFETILGGSFIQLTARWEFGDFEAIKVYQEVAIIGPGDDGQVGFWSFTSDGKRSQGTVADVSDLHPKAIGFEAQMPAGRARMAYWPTEAGGFIWVVEARNEKGWKRVVEHTYCPA